MVTQTDLTVDATKPSMVASAGETDRDLAATQLTKNIVCDAVFVEF
jgi:hypothetical protein